MTGCAGKTVLVTRPVEDASALAAVVESMGYRAVCAPVLDIVLRDAVLPDPALYDVLIFSSVNGVRGFLHNAPAAAYFSRPVFAVGENTAQAAQEAGFSDVSAGNGTMRDTVRLLKDDLARGRFPSTVRILHMRGRDIREDPAGMLPCPVDGVVLYDANPVGALPADVLSLLRERKIDAITFYSARSAQAFVEALNRLWIDADLRGVKALCLADSVLEFARRLNGVELRVASTPDRTGMIRLLEELK